MEEFHLSVFFFSLLIDFIHKIWCVSVFVCVCNVMSSPIGSKMKHLNNAGFEKQQEKILHSYDCIFDSCNQLDMHFMYTGLVKVRVCKHFYNLNVMSILNSHAHAVKGRGSRLPAHQLATRCFHHILSSKLLHTHTRL